MKVDIDRMTGGKDVLQRVRGSEKGGIPWFAILDAEGKTLSTSDGPKGNVGYPFKPEEIEHFISMLKGTRRRMGEDDVATIEAGLRRIAGKIEAESGGG